MDYNELARGLSVISKYEKRRECNEINVGNVMEQAATAITDLLDRAEEAEDRAEKAEKKLEAAVKELDGVAAAVDDLSDFIDEQIHPLVPYDFYTALRENADAISMWEHEEEWRGRKEE